MPVKPGKPITYKDAGHDLDRSDSIIARLRERLPEIGGFGGVVPLPRGRWQQPLLVSGTDGVGTKVLLAVRMNKHDTVGIDLVAMVVNDIIVTGAKPFFFLDYIATGELDPDVIDALITGVLEGCEQAGCELAGGETAEMAGLYGRGHYDLAGFGVGIVEKTRLVDGTSVRPGDVLIGLESSGLHSNGYTLARAIVKRGRIGLGRGLKALEGRSAGEALLQPTRIYVPLVLDLLKKFEVKAMANITGGGLPGNVGRTLPPTCDAEIETDAWPTPPVFALLQERGPVEIDEMFRTFNMGIGFTMVVCGKDAARVVKRCDRLGVPAHLVGRVVEGDGKVRLC